MDNSYAIETFINFCEAMQIAEEGTFIKGSFKNAVLSSVTARKQISALKKQARAAKKSGNFAEAIDCWTKIRTICINLEKSANDTISDTVTPYGEHKKNGKDKEYTSVNKAATINYARSWKDEAEFQIKALKQKASGSSSSRSSRGHNASESSVFFDEFMADLY